MLRALSLVDVLSQLNSDSSTDVAFDPNEVVNALLAADETLVLTGESLTIATTTDYPTAIIEVVGPVGYWTLDDDPLSTVAGDSSPWGTAAYPKNPATVFGTVGFGATGAMYQSAGATFDGATGYLEAADVAALEMIGDLSIECWLKPASLAAAQTIVSKGVAGEYHLTLNTDGSMTFAMGAAFTATVVPAATITTGAWWHVVVTRGAQGKTLHGYTNGVQTYSGTYAAAPSTTANPVRWAATSPGAAADFFNGTLDECVLYARPLTAAQVTDHYAWATSHDEGAPHLSAYDTAILAASPVAYLPLSADGTDLTGNGHSGTVYGHPQVGTWLNGDPVVVYDGSAAQYTEIPDSVALSVPATGILTIEAWIRPDVLNFPIAEGIGPYAWWAGKLGTHNSTTQAEWACRIYSQTSYRPNRVSGYVFNNSGGLGAGSYSEDVVSVGEWIHYVLVINTINTSGTYPTGYTSIYKDGVHRDQDSLSDYSIVPAHAGAPLRIGTATLDSFFRGAICKFAVYGYEPTPTQIFTRYRSVVAAVVGSISRRSHVGDTTGVGTSKLTVVVATPVAAGSTVIVQVAHAYADKAPTCADSRGNPYTLLRTTVDSGKTVRLSRFAGQINVALSVGDAVQVVMSSAVTPAAMVADEFSGIAFSNPVDAANSGQGTGTTPGTSIATGTTTQADELVLATMAVSGPTTDTYAEDIFEDYHTLTRAGTNTGGTDLALNPAYKSVKAIGNWKYQPTLGTSRSWLEIITTLRAGPCVPVPPPQGSATYVGRVGANASTTSGSTIAVTVPVGGVPAGATLVVAASESFAGTSPTCIDTRGNTYSQIRTAADGSSTQRGVAFRATIATPLLSGDLITVSFGGSRAVRAIVVDQFAGLSVGTVDVQNGVSGSSASPSVSSLATTNADDLLYGVVFASQSAASGLTNTDVLHQWTGLPAAGTTTAGGTADKAIYAAFRVVGQSVVPTYAPTLAATAPWVAFVFSLRTS